MILNQIIFISFNWVHESEPAAVDSQEIKYIDFSLILMQTVSLTYILPFRL